MNQHFKRGVRSKCTFKWEWDIFGLFLNTVNIEVKERVQEFEF